MNIPTLATEIDEQLATAEECAQRFIKEPTLNNSRRLTLATMRASCLAQALESKVAKLTYEPKH